MSQLNKCVESQSKGKALMWIKLNVNDRIMAISSSIALHEVDLGLNSKAYKEGG